MSATQTAKCPMCGKIVRAPAADSLHGGGDLAARTLHSKCQSCGYTVQFGEAPAEGAPTAASEPKRRFKERPRRK